jgi:hypothetical protein
MATVISSESRPNVDIHALERFLSAIGSYAPWLTYGPKSGEPLYHYTDLGGLLGIVKNHDLWLTHSRYSNDDEEITLGYRTAKDVIEQARKARNLRKNPDWLLYLDALGKCLDAPTTAGFYICCFCQADDLLSQWRSYGANGSGVCINFQWEGFDYVGGADSPHGGLMRLWKVYYDANKQRRILRKAIDYAFEQPQNPTATPEERARQAADFIEFFIPTFKDYDFREEQEYRLIFSPPPNCVIQPQFRPARGMLIPYYSLRELSGNPRPLPITSVRLGPSANKELNAESALMLLKNATYFNTRVEISDTPYRG